MSQDRNQTQHPEGHESKSAAEESRRVDQQRRPWRILAAGILLAAGGAMALTVLLVQSSAPKASGPSSLASATIRRTFVSLAAARTDVCRDIGSESAIESYMSSLPNNAMLQGSCCRPMDLNKYTSQIDGLKQYSSIPEVPKDPYSVSVASARQMIGFYNDIDLSPTQQGVFASAASMTTDNGWCCCQCWAWYAHAGLAKFLITQYSFTASQVASVINLEDCCGGT